MSERSENQERLFQQLDDAVAEIIDRFANEGHGTARVVETLQDVLAKRQLAYDRDPDPADEPIEEPANEWPAADNPSNENGGGEHEQYGRPSRRRRGNRQSDPDARRSASSNCFLPATEESGQELAGR